MFLNWQLRKADVQTKLIHWLNFSNAQYRFAKRYGLVEETNSEVKFYFENYESENKYLRNIATL